MEGFTIHIIPDSEEQIRKIESLRKSVFHLKQDAPNRYAKPIRDGMIIPFALYKGDELIGGCYVGDGYDSLYIYYLFIREDYQKTGQNIGRRFLQNIINHKEQIEVLLNHPVKQSALHPMNDNLKKVYRAIGYQDGRSGMMVRAI